MITANKYKASVIIPFYKNREPLLATLTALSKQDLPADTFEIVVVDDGESDTETERVIADSFTGTQIRYLTYSVNRGAAYARNFGWRQSKGEVAIFLDGDQIVKNDFVRQHINFFEHIPDSVPLLQMGLRNEINTVTPDTEDLEKFTTGTDARFVLFEKYSENMQSIRGAWHLCFSHNLSVRRRDLDATGGFDEEIFHGWGLEDSEFAYNFFKRGVKIAYNPNILVYHISHPLNWNSPEGYQLWNKNLQAFVNKHPDHAALMQCIFRDFFNPDERQRKIESGDKRPWITCYTKFEEAIRIMLGESLRRFSRTLKNPDKEALFEMLTREPDQDLTILVSKDNIDLIASIQVRPEAKNVALFTY